jgi:hypothetical protein
LPDDQIEGSVWSYKIEAEKGGKPVEGSFRVDGDAIYAVDRTIKVKPPSPRKIRNIIKGKEAEITLPGGDTSAKRIGDIVKKGSKYRIDFIEEKPFTGMMHIGQKEKGSTVWVGYFREKSGSKYGKRQDVELRLKED